MRKDILTLYGIGNIRFGASIASLAAVGFYRIGAALPAYGFSFHLGLFLVVSIAAFFSLKKDKSYATTDPKEIVVDEFLGMYACLILASTDLLFKQVFLFAIFRIIDILKPFPFSWIDKNIKGYFGPVVDDVVIGVFIGLLFLV